MNAPQISPEMNTRISLKSLTSHIWKNWNFTTSEEYFQAIGNHIPEIKAAYAQRARGIIDSENLHSFYTNEPDETEILQLVDENDQPIRDRDGAYAAEFRGNWYDEQYVLDPAIEEKAYCRAAMFILENPKGEIFVPHRAKGSGGLLSIAGWHVTDGSSYEETCLREANEELNYDPELLKIPPLAIGKFRFGRKTPKKDPRKAGQILSLFRLVTKRGDIQPNPKEISGITTFTKRDLLERLVSNIQGFLPFHAYSYLTYLEKTIGIKAIESERAEYLRIIKELKASFEQRPSFGEIKKIG